MSVKGLAISLGVAIVAILAYHNGALNFLPGLSAPKK